MELISKQEALDLATDSQKIHEAEEFVRKSINQRIINAANEGYYFTSFCLLSSFNGFIKSSLKKIKKELLAKNFKICDIADGIEIHWFK